MAIIYEANRQVDLIEEGKSIDQETRLFDTKKNETRSMRSKEDAHDYRYFPDPDLLPLELNDNYIDKIKKDMVWSKRPGTGIPSYLMSKIIGRYAKKKIKANKLIMWGDLK